MAYYNQKKNKDNQMHGKNFIISLFCTDWQFTPQISFESSKVP
jgi:hypothetical protein